MVGEVKRVNSGDDQDSAGQLEWMNMVLIQESEPWMSEIRRKGGRIRRNQSGAGCSRWAEERDVRHALVNSDRSDAKPRSRS